MKHVFPTDEIPHLWAHKTQSDARNQAGNLFFTDDTIYSYGSHFAIARHVTGKRKDSRAILFNSQKYSVTTAKHQSMVRSAIPHDIPMFTVPNLWDMDHTANLKYLASECAENIQTAARARSSWRIESSLQNARALRQSAIDYAKFFGVKRPKLPTVPEVNSEKLAAIKAAEKKQAARKAAEHKAEHIARKARIAELRADYETKLPIQIQEWRDGKRNHIDIAPYAAYDYNDPKPTVPTMLRIEGNEVVTSHGARVPIDHARRAVFFVQQIVASGTEYVRNGHTFHVGHYTLDRVETNGTVHAGCHVIPYSEIQRIAPLLLATEPTTV